jgi:hypothetical protein
MTTQVFNDEMMNLIATDFQRRYEPNFAWGNVISMYQQLPGLIGFWPGVNGTTGGAFQLRDVSGSGLHLGGSASPAVTAADSTGLRTWAQFNGVANYYSTADTAYNSILGSETSMLSAIRGLTVMAWVRPSTAPANLEVVAGKFTSTGNQRSWILRRGASGSMSFSVSGDGAAQQTATSTNAFAQNEWRFVAGRYTPSAQARIWEGFTYGLVTNENATSIPALLFDSNANLSVGARDTELTAVEFWAGDLSLIALCRAALPDLFIESIFNLTRPLFIRR